MMTFHSSLLAGALTMGVVAAVALTGCASETAQSHGTRATLYASASEMAEDSSLVVIGTVESTTEANDLTGDPSQVFTLATLSIEQVLQGDAQEKEVVVRQIGSPAAPGPAKPLEEGGTYLLYLTASGLDGELASQFYVTGGNAGLYSASESASRGTSVKDLEFQQVDPEPGESLPESVDLTDFDK